MSNSLDPDQVRCFVRPDPVQTISKGHQHTTLVGKELNAIQLDIHIENQTTFVYEKRQNTIFSTLFTKLMTYLCLKSPSVIEKLSFK